MYTICMTPDKTLFTTNSTSIRVGESNADNFVFFLPTKYNEQDIIQCNVVLNYIDLTGNSSSIELSVAPDIEKENFLAYKLPITSVFTKSKNKYAMWIEISTLDKEFVLRTGAIFVSVQDDKVLEPIPQEDVPELLDLWNKEMQRIYQETLKLQEEYQDKADSIILKDGKYQLTASGKLVGDSVPAVNLIWEDI